MDRNQDTQYPWMEGDPRRSSDMELSTSLESANGSLSSFLLILLNKNATSPDSEETW